MLKWAVAVMLFGAASATALARTFSASDDQPSYPGVQVSPPGVPPPPPPIVLENFPSSNRVHVLDVKCGAGRLRLSWSAKDYESARITEFEINGVQARHQLRQQLDDYLQEFRYDVHIWAECTYDVAAFSIIDIATAGTSKPKQIKLNLIGEQLTVFGRYNYGDDS